MTTKTPFMMPFRFALDQPNSFAMHDAEGHFICRVITSETVVETEQLARQMTAAAEMRALLDTIAARTEAIDPQNKHAADIRALLARIDGTEDSDVK